jgi:hypothetical protein
MPNPPVPKGFIPDAPPKGFIPDSQQSGSVKDVPGAVPGMAEPGVNAVPKANLKPVNTPQGEWNALTQDIPVQGSPTAFASNFGGHAIGAVPKMLRHPVDAAASMFKPLSMLSFGNPNGMYSTGFEHPSIEQGIPLAEKIKSDPGRAISGMLGDLAAQGAAGMGAGEALDLGLPKIAEAGTAIRTAAIGDADAAGLRGLRVGSGSPKSLSTISAIKGSRPFLKGVTSLEDLQTRIPVAKAEIWGPYQKTIDAIGGKEALGPDGPTTISALEAERQQLSALNRGLKQQNPEAIQLAQQKGMTQAQLLDREKAIQQSLDPYLEKAGIDPKIIRKTFGQVSQIGSRASGKSTLAEKPQPFGFGKMTNLSIEHPLQAPAQILSGARDLVAGRPLWSGKPTDIALQEAFRTGGEKPNFGAYRAGPPPLQLEANVPGNAPYGENYSVGPTAPIEHIEHPIRVTPPPPTFRALPAETQASEPQPMIRYARPYVEPYDPKFSPTNIEEYLRSRGK